MVKDLKDLVEISKGKISWMSLNSLNCTYPIPNDIDNAVILDFKNVTNPEDLIVSGFDSICATCDKHYSVVFTPTDNISIEQSGYRDIFLSIGVENLDINTPQDFTRFLFNTIKNSDKFINHYTQYYYQDTKLYIYDYRGNTETEKINFFTTVYKIPVDIYATYNNSVPVGTHINLENLKIYVRYSTYEDEEISFADCEIQDSLIKKIGDNVVIIKYEGKKYNLIVKGIPNLQSITASYLGGRVKIGKEGYTELDKDLFNVVITSISKGEETLESNQFTISPSVISEPLTEIEVTYENEYESIRTYITVESELAVANLMVWYEGEDVITGNNYDPEKVIIYTIDVLGNFKLIHFQDSRIILDSLFVSEIGENWFTCTFIENGQKVQDIYCVNGIVPDSIIDKNLRIMYIKNKVNTYNTDVTSNFLPYVKLDGVTVVSLKNFLKACNELFYYDGIFKVTIPANTGFNCRFASQWIFIVLDGKTIKAKQIKEFRY